MHLTSNPPSTMRWSMLVLSPLPYLGGWPSIALAFRSGALQLGEGDGWHAVDAGYNAKNDRAVVSD